tara:strand:- start:1931 stop:2191 length:261 start_codon:yes stop_codon:yes gene_type:complete
MMADVLRIPTGQIMGIIAAIATVGMYSARVDSKVTENAARVVELKADLQAIQRDVVKHGEVLATLKADSKHILRALEIIKKTERRK